ncbi:MAG: hypothetical protein CM1200mP24_07210 [Gammaproteobacteria bacterium]|nr:MAG: hypothetical protein CM1200mP24_07210 [Gammaproteobacteria bacterium]
MAALPGKIPKLRRRSSRPLLTLPVIAKLTPNVTDMGEVAVACARAGATAISAINTLAALMSIQNWKGRSLVTALAVYPVPLFAQSAYEKCSRSSKHFLEKTLLCPLSEWGDLHTDDVIRYLLCGHYGTNRNLSNRQS